MQQHSIFATEFRYYAGALTRRFKQARHARELASVIDKWASKGFSVSLVGHSNGCDLIERALKICCARVENLHLISAASEANLAKAGYESLLESGDIYKIFIYCSRKDFVLKTFAKFSRIFNPFGLGYGILGYTGPTSPLIDARVSVIQRNLGHSEWFEKGNYNFILKSITNYEQ